MFAFQTTEIYKKSKNFHLECKKLIQQISIEKNVSDQLRRASYSIPLNIAEGSGKFSNPDRKNYFTTARASVFEWVAIIDILYDEGKISQNEYCELNATCTEMSKMLYSMIKNLE